MISPPYGFDRAPPLALLSLVAACASEGANPTVQAEGRYSTTAQLTTSVAWTYGSTISYPEWGDYDADLDLDLVGVANGRVSVFRNNGASASPRFSRVWSSPLTSDTAQKLQWGDYDRDGYLDILVANDPLRIYHYIGGDQFTAVDFPGISTPGDVATVVDIDNDGDMDLMTIAGWYDGVAIYYRENGQWNESSLISTYDLAMAFAWGDYNDDGYPDLVTGNDGDWPQVFYRNDSGSLTRMVYSEVCVNRVSVAWGDYNSDGVLDFVTGDSAFPTELYDNQGNDVLRFDKIGPAALADNYTYDVRWIDFDGDGDLDLMAWDNDVGWKSFRNEGDGNLVAATDVPLGVWGDYDGDGDFDVISGGTVYENLSTTPIFTQVWVSSVPLNSGTWIDCDDDGDLDLLTANEATYNVVRNNKANGFSLVWNAPDLPAFGDRAYAVIRVADFNADGRPDIVASKGPGLIVYRGGRHCTFSLQWSNDDVEAVDIAIGDMNADGRPDLVIAGDNNFGNGQHNSIFTQNANGSFTSLWRSASPIYTQAVSLNDYDRDGDVDAAFATADVASQVCANDGAANLVCTGSLPAARGLHWGSYAPGNAGKKLALTDTNNTLRFFAYNSGTHGFDEETTLAVASAPTIKEWGDFDGNGTLDLIASDYTVPARIYSWNGASFAQVWQTPINANEGESTFGDFDGDGDLDIAVSYGYPEKISGNLSQRAHLEPRSPAREPHVRHHRRRSPQCMHAGAGGVPD